MFDWCNDEDGRATGATMKRWVFDQCDNEDARTASALLLALHEVDNRKNECNISGREIVRG